MLITQVSAGFQVQRWRQPKWKNWVWKNDKCHFTEATLDRVLIPNNEKVTMAANRWAWFPPDKSFEGMYSQDKCVRVLKDQDEKQWELWITNKLHLTFWWLVFHDLGNLPCYSGVKKWPGDLLNCGYIHHRVQYSYQPYSKGRLRVTYFRT